MSRKNYEEIRRRAKEAHRNRMAQNEDRVEFARVLLGEHGIDYEVKNKRIGHIHAWRKSDNKLFQFYAGTGKILGSEQRGIHNFVKILDDIK